MDRHYPEFFAEFQPESIRQSRHSEDDFEMDLPEALQDGAANIGESAIQVFAMEIPAYPRKEGLRSTLLHGVEKADCRFPCGGFTSERR